MLIGRVNKIPSPNPLFARGALYDKMAADPSLLGSRPFLTACVLYRPLIATSSLDHG